MVKVRYHGETDDLIFIDGNVYELAAIHKVGDKYLYAVIDEVGDPTFAFSEVFEIVEGDIESFPVYEYDEEKGEDVRIK